MTSLKIDNIYLSTIERHNLVTIHQWFKEAENIFWLSHLSISPLNLDEIEIWYNSLINNFRSKVFMINLVDSKSPVGILELSQIDWKNRNCELGVLIGNKAQLRKGFATKAIKVALNLVFHQWNLNKIYAKVVQLNLPSIKLFEKLNFTKEAVLKEHLFMDSNFQDQVIFSLTKKQYEVNLEFYKK